MPNHLHGIIIIEDSPSGKSYGLSNIIKSFKTVCTKAVRKKLNNYSFAWQRSFYDHVIRNDESLQEIRQYIADNPLKLHIEKNHLENYL